MNRTVYLHLLRTYGRRPGVWFGLLAEVVRTSLIRIWGILVTAEIASSLAGGDIERARRYAVYFLIIYVTSPLVSLAGELIAYRAENQQWQTLSMTYYQRLIGKDMAFYRNNRTGYLASLFRQYMDGAMTLIRLLRSDAVKVAVGLLGPVIVLFLVDVRLGLVAFGIVFVQLIYVLWSSSKANKYREMSHEVYRKVTGEVADEITNVVAFKSAGMEREARGKVARLTKEEVATFWLRRKTTLLLDLPRSLITAFGATAALFVVLSSRSSTPETVGTVVLTLSYMLTILRNVGELPELIIRHDDLVTKIYPTLAYLSSEHETIRDPQKPKRLNITSGAIDIDHVDFAYTSYTGRDTETTVFKDLTIHIKGGERVGIVGLSGAGKSTLAGLLMRFDDVSSGAIKVDGIDVRNVRQSALRKSIAYVPQEPLLFHRTVKENIAYFNTTAKNPDVVRAAKAAHAHEFISNLPHGYDTLVGERGVKLSGGQKQRVVIARAILKNAPIMIFDEATSALDSESEQIIQRALPKIIGKHTAVVIAHRLSTVAGLDRIIVMHAGKIVEEGTHQALLKRRGRYYALWQKQVLGSE